MIKLVYGDDWEALYVDGKLVAQDHSIYASDLLHALKLEFEIVEADLDWLGEKGCFPEDFEDVKLED